MNFIPVSSSDLSQVGYDKSKSELTIIFKSGGVYTYLNVPESVYTGLLGADSQGKYFHAYIKDSYTFRKSY